MDFKKNFIIDKSAIHVDQTVMFDLHGYSVERAQKLVAHNIKQARSRGWNKIRFVTGRGNHLNSRGERGTLYKNFKDWLKGVQNNIAKIEQYDGYYEIGIKKGIALRNPFIAMMNQFVEESLIANIEEIKNSAEKGEVEGLTALACCYEKGVGVEKNYQKATALYQQLAEKNIAWAQYEMGCRFFIGKGIKQNDKHALKYLKLAAEQNDVLAEFSLGEIYAKGFDAFPINYPLSNEYYLKAAKHGHAESARKIGCSYEAGLGINQDYAQAIHWWEKSCELGDCVAAFNLCGMYQDGKGVSKDLKKSNQYLILSAERGDPDGQRILGFCYYFGDKSFKKNKEISLVWLKRAAENESPEAQYFLFIHHRTLQEIKPAKEYLIAAASNHHILAQFLIATSDAVSVKSPSDQRMLNENKANAQAENTQTEIVEDLYSFSSDLQKTMMENLVNQPANQILQLEDNITKFAIIDLLLYRNNTKRQMKKGIRILERLAEEKDTRALAQLAAIYFSGHKKMIKKDPLKAYDYWLRGANLGDSDCLCGLGYFWHDGLGGEVNLKKGVEYFEQSAKLGNAHANNMLGTYYASDQYGVKKDLKKAVEYLQRAMELDHPKKRKECRDSKQVSGSGNTFKYAAKNLAILYLNGDEGFPKYEAKAIELLEQSAQDGMADSSFMLFRKFFQYYVETKEEKFTAAAGYYLNLAVKQDHKLAKKMAVKMPAELKSGLESITMALDEKDVEKAPLNKEAVKTKLQLLTTGWCEQLDWKISKDDKAWAYLSDDQFKKLTANDKLKPYFKKAAGGQHLLVFENIYECDFVELALLFAAGRELASTSKNVSSISAVSAPALFSGSAQAISSALPQPQAANPVITAKPADENNKSTNANISKEPDGFSTFSCLVS